MLLWVLVSSGKGKAMDYFEGAGKMATAPGHGLRWEESSPGWGWGLKEGEVVHSTCSY